jgi:hypothetical protein
MLERCWNDSGSFGVGRWTMTKGAPTYQISGTVRPTRQSKEHVNSLKKRWIVRTNG